MSEEQQPQEEQPKENPDEMKFFEELNLSDFQEYEDLFKAFCDFKSGKIEKEALKEKLFELRFRKLSDEDLDKILEETELMKDGAVSIFFLLFAFLFLLFFSCIILFNFFLSFFFFLIFF